MESPALAAPTATTFAPKLFSGVELIDRAWGGLYRGGSYLLYGRAASGRDLITLRFAQTGAEHGESCLFVSPARPKDLMIQAASIGFNLRQHYESGTVKLMRIPQSLAGEGDEDEAILRSMRDLVALVRQHKPSRLVLNDFMPFVLFRSEARFRTAFTEMLEHTDVLDMTTVFVMSEPANAQSKKVVDFISEQMTGTVHIEMPENDADSPKRRLTLTPRLGHVRKRIVELWDVNDLLDEPVATYPAPPEPAPLPALPAPEAPAFVPEPAPEPAFETAPAPATRGIRLGRALADMPEAPALPSAPQAMPPFVVPMTEAASGPFVAPASAEPEGALWSDMPAAVAPPAPPIVMPVITPDSMDFATSPASTSFVDMAMPSVPSMPAGLEPRLDRDAFAARLQQHFDQHGHDGTPFLVIAMRLERSAAVLNPFNFDFVSDVVNDALRPGDDLLVDPASERLVVLLPSSDGDAANTFFTRLKQRLREDAPQQAEELFRAISAIAVANGRMFGSAGDLLAYALDTP